MTKFEEELFNKVKVTNIELTTEAEYKKSTLINHFKNWHSDEEFQELKEQNENQAESILLMLDEIKSLKSQLQQQALPVVPEDVAEQIERVRNNNGTYTTLGLFDSNYDKKPDYAKWIEDNINEFMVACSVGYTVEKPKVFFLKNTLTYDYLYRKYKNSLGEQSYCKGTDGKPLDYCLFTLDEINSMNTGIYEQIEVEK